jgi:hemerythrin
MNYAFEEDIPMAIIEWSDDYRVDGNIDNEHRRLFTLANEVFEIIDPNLQAPKLKNAVKSLYEYLQFHFGNEQRLMCKIEYPEYDHQIAMHKAIIAEANEVMTSSHTLAELHASLQHLMVKTILAHILREDRKIGLFIRRKSAFSNGLQEPPTANLQE